jgi:hypothetical protein
LPLFFPLSPCIILFFPCIILCWSYLMLAMKLVMKQARTLAVMLLA